jgi:hypothetical protein
MPDKQCPPYQCEGNRGLPYSDRKGRPLPRVKKHAQLWAQELLMEKDKLSSLTAAQKIRELALLTSTLESLTN